MYFTPPFLIKDLVEYFLHTHVSLIQINYMLDEDRNWAIDISSLKDDLEEARTSDDPMKRCDPRIMVVINPGNPTGDSQYRENLVIVFMSAVQCRLW